jgi:hypothetical protein
MLKRVWSLVPSALAALLVTVAGCGRIGFEELMVEPSPYGGSSPGPGGADGSGGEERSTAGGTAGAAAGGTAGGAGVAGAGGTRAGLAFVVSLAPIPTSLAMVLAA